MLHADLDALVTALDLYLPNNVLPVQLSELYSDDVSLAKEVKDRHRRSFALFC
jgi:hypothetical protein